MEKTKQGIIVFDEGANAKLKPYIQKSGWRVNAISNIDRGIRFKDPSVAKKYTKGKYPLFTGDKRVCYEVPHETGATGYVVQETTIAPTDLDQYGLKVQKFFKEHKSRHLYGVVWRIPKKDKPFIIISNIYEKKKK